MNQLLTILTKHRSRNFILTIGILAIGWIFLTPPTLTGDLNGFKLENNQHFDQYQYTDSLFGGREQTFVVITPNTDNRTQVFKYVKTLSNSIQKNFPESHIISPITFYKRLKYQWNSSDNSLASFLSKSTDIPILNQLIAKDKKSFLMIINTKQFELEKIKTLIHSIEAASPYIQKTQAISPSIIELAIEKYITHDIQVILFLILLFFFAYNMYAFRSLKAIIFSGTLIISSILATLLLFSIFEFQLNIISILAIPIVLILALSDALHMLSGYVKNKESIPKDEKLKSTINHYLIPSFFSSLTTAAAFLSFYFFNDSSFIQEFGLITSLALMIEFAIAFLMAPFLLDKLHIQKIHDQPFINFASFLTDWKNPISVFLVITLLISPLIISKLEFKSSNELFFPVNSQIEEVHNELCQNYSSNLRLDVLIKGAATTTKNDLYSYTKILSERFRNENTVVHVNSATNNFTVLSNTGFPVNLFKILGANNPYYNQKEKVYRVELEFPRADDIVAFQQTRLDKILRETPPGISTTYSSLAILTNEVNKSVSSSLIKSLSTSGIVIFIIMLFFTRSIKMAFFSLIPNLAPISFILLLFYLFHIPINIVSAIAVVISLGLLDDDTIHILYRKLWLKQPLEELQFSILSSAIILVVGFGFFLTSSFTPIQVLGWVSAVIFIIGVISEFTLMQLVLNQTKDDV